MFYCSCKVMCLGKRASLTIHAGFFLWSLYISFFMFASVLLQPKSRPSPGNAVKDKDFTKTTARISKT